MSSVVGVLCNDGAVIGTDSSATFQAGQFRTIEQPVNKIEVVSGHIIVAGSGPIGLGQRLCAQVEKAWDDDVFTGAAIDVARELCKRAVVDFTSTGAPKGQFGAMVAFCCDTFVTPQLCEFIADDFQPELKTDALWYASHGSAQPITDPFLGFIRDVFWEKGPPNTQDGLFAVTWTLQQAIDLNPGGVKGPIQMAVLERGKKGKLKARRVADDEIEQHLQMVLAAKQHLRGFLKVFNADEGGPSVPKPAAPT